MVSLSTIVYYECENPDCGLRFPDFSRDLERERCPMCRRGVHPADAYEVSPLEDKLPPPPETALKLIGFLDNIRSSLNVGAIFRSADGIGVGPLILGGITPSPEDRGLQKTALGAEQSVAWEKANHGVNKIRQMKAAGFQVWGLESTPQADGLYSIASIIPPQPLILVVGNEVCGIDPQIIRLCHRVIYIPMVGHKRSYNVATAFGIAASYIRYCQILFQGSVSKLPNTSSMP